MVLMPIGRPLSPVHAADAPAVPPPEVPSQTSGAYSPSGIPIEELPPQYPLVNLNLRLPAQDPDEAGQRIAAIPREHQEGRSALQPSAEIQALAAGLDHDPRLIYEYVHNNSINAGGNWSPINTGLAADSVYALAIGPQASGTLYAGTEMGIFKSTNGGDTWQGSSSGFSGRKVYALAFAGDALLAGTDRRAFKSVNGGASWTPANQGLAANEVYCLASPGGTVYAGTERGVFLSDNGGASWQTASDGLPVGAAYALAVARGRPQIVFAATSQGVYATSDGGGRWAALNEGLSGWALEVTALALDFSSSTWTLYAGTGSGVWKRVGVGYGAYLPLILRD